MGKDVNGNLVTVWQSGVKVNAALLEDVYFVKKVALKPVRYGDHGMRLFRFVPGGVTAPDGAQTRALVVSLDAYYTDPVEVVYSPLEALSGRYQVYYSIQTGERYSDGKFNYIEFNLPNALELQPYPLLLDRARETRRLEAAITKATGNNKGEMYSLFYNSCATSPDAMAALLGKRGAAAGHAGELPRLFLGR